MNNYTYFKQTPRNLYNTPIPSKRVIENILNYSKTMQAKRNTGYRRVLFFMNN